MKKFLITILTIVLIIGVAWLAYVSINSGDDYGIAKEAEANLDECNIRDVTEQTDGACQGTFGKWVFASKSGNVERYTRTLNGTRTLASTVRRATVRQTNECRNFPSTTISETGSFCSLTQEKIVNIPAGEEVLEGKNIGADGKTTTGFCDRNPNHNVCSDVNANINTISQVDGQQFTRNSQTESSVAVRMECSTDNVRWVTCNGATMTVPSLNTDIRLRAIAENGGRIATSWSVDPSSPSCGNATVDNVGQTLSFNSDTEQDSFQCTINLNETVVESAGVGATGTSSPATFTVQVVIDSTEEQ